MPKMHILCLDCILQINRMHTHKVILTELIYCYDIIYVKLACIDIENQGQQQIEI
jgi:hypothetical protein